MDAAPDTLVEQLRAPRGDPASGCEECDEARASVRPELVCPGPV